ncbi:MAG: RNA polymerase sigma factor [Candidatus Pacebacteria bacterium]|nr:RNA polymerase sigma factor [Candidatus Paceibacterota bacterium]
MERTDDQLITEYRQGDETAFKELIERYIHPIYAFTFRLTGREAEANDIAQETFVKVWKKLPVYKLSGTFKSWIFAIARNTAIDYLRKKKSAVFSDFENESGKNSLTETLSDPDTIPAELIRKAEEKELLGGGLETLSVDDREILSLHYDQEMTFEEIGAIVKKPLNTVKSRHRRALAKLRTYFEHKDT